ncbi:hypothetical protein CLAIMM_03326 [Cladophialophora immunda]|nr:hypothetical protein CLAIMM_03326 [Cladophialophora immunda]
MTKNSRPLQWTPTAERLLLEWVEQNKGPDGTLRQNFELALDELATYLHDQFPSAPHLSAIALKSRIRDKLRRVWNKYRSAKYQTTPFTATTFFDEGIAALDEEKLGSNFANLFPPEQPQDHLASADNSSPSPSQQGAKRKAEEAPDSNLDAGDCSSPKRVKSTEPARSTTPESSSDDSLQIATNDVDEPETEILINTNTGMSPEGHSNVVEEVTPAGEITPSIASEAFVETETAVPPLAGADLPEDWRQTSMMSKMKKFYEGHYEKMRFLLDDAATPQNDILLRGVMDRLDLDIELAVSSFVDNAGVPPTQPVFLDPMFIYPDELEYLLSEVIPKDRRREFEALQRSHTSAISWKDLAHALVAQAVTEWCLAKIPDQYLFFHSSLKDIFEEVHEQYFDPVVVAQLKEKLWTRHIDKQVLPHTRAKAEQMAAQALQYLELLLPRSTGFFSSKCLTGVKWHGPIDQLPPNKEGAPVPDPLQEPAERAEFRDKLISIFESALNWRTEVCKNLNVDLNFTFPAFGDAYSRERMCGHSEGGMIGGRVYLALTPVVEWRRRWRVLEEHHPLSVVSPARVIALEPLDQQP